MSVDIFWSRQPKYTSWYAAFLFFDQEPPKNPRSAASAKVAAMRQWLIAEVPYEPEYSKPRVPPTIHANIYTRYPSRSRPDPKPIIVERFFKRDALMAFARKNDFEPLFLFPNKDSSDRANAPKTARATHKKQNIKADRLKALEAFLNEMDRRAKAADRCWTRSNIPITKRDFCSVFKRKNPNFKETSNRTISNDLGQFGVHFDRGTKHKKNNALESIFAELKYTQ